MWGLTSIYMHCFTDSTVENKIVTKTYIVLRMAVALKHNSHFNL
jgi:hypothetical protein